ncbi:MAG: hydroxyacid dehydrogenase [Anaerolineae bacterium]|nr:hydroxyacid dehydrogenase [Anaerolineae bacterium]
MYRIWCERLLAPQYVPLLDEVAEAIQPASGSVKNSLETLPGCHAVIATSRLQYDGVLMDRVPTLRVIARPGIGVDNISIPDATERGIVVCNTPDGPTISTAEHAVTLMLAVIKQIKRFDRELQRGAKADYFNEYNSPEVRGLQLGLVGLGRIGRYVAGVAQALGMKVIAYDPFITHRQAAELGVEWITTLSALLSTADVVSLHVPLTSETRHLINAARLAQMKPGAYLINTARGGLVDESALLAALECRQLSGAGLDVFEHEPPAPDSPLLTREDVIATPHLAGVTSTSKDRMVREAIQQVLQVLHGEQPAHVVNPQVWSLKR